MDLLGSRESCVPAVTAHHQEAGRGLEGPAGPGGKAAATLAADDRLARNFKTDAPDKVWVANNTHLVVLSGFLFLVIILDVFAQGGRMVAR